MGNFLDYVRGSQGKKKTTNSNTAKLGNFGKYAAQQKKISLEQTIGLDTLQSDLSSMGKTIEGIYGGWQTQETMNNTRSSVESMYNRLNAYQEYQQKFGGTDISEIVNGYKTVLDEWDDRTKVYGYYKTADAFNVARKNAQIAEQFKGLSYDEVQAEKKKYKADSDEYKYLDSYTDYSNLDDYNKAIDDLTSDKWYALIDGKPSTKVEDVSNLHIKDLTNARNVKFDLSETYDTYRKYMQNEDFAEKSKYVSTEGKFNNGWDAFTKGQYAMGYGDLTYEYINNVDGLRDKIKAEKRVYGRDSGNTTTSEEKKGYDNLTPDEISVYNYIYATKGKEKAQEFLDGIEMTLTKREYEEDTQRWNEWADSNATTATLASLASIPASVYGTIPTAVDAIKDAAQGKPYNPYSYNKALTNFAFDTREYVGENIEEATEGMDVFGQNIPSFLYSTGMSIGDSALGATTMQGFYAPLAGTNAFHQKAKEMTEAGESEDVIYGTALASGAAEVVFEYISIDRLLKIKNVDSGQKMIKEALKQAGVEMSEEMLTETSNILTDTLIRGDTSELHQMYSDLIERGYTESQANTEIAKEIGSKIGWAGVGGFLSGGSMGSVASANNYSAMSSLGRDIKDNARTEEMLEIASMTPKESEAYKAYSMYAGKGITADNIKNAQLGNLYYSTKTDARDVLSSKKTSQEQKANAIDTLNKLHTIDTENVEAKRVSQRVSEIKTGEVTEETSTGNSFTLEGIKFGKDDTTLVTSEGEKSINEVTLSANDAELVAYAEGMTEKEANLLISQYDGKSKVSNYVDSFNLVMDYSKLNYTHDMILEHKGVLSEKQVSAIYAETVKASFEEQQNAVKKLSEKYGATLSIQGNFDDSIIDYNNTTTDGSKVNWKDLTSTQRSAVRFTQLFSKATGVNVRFIQSQVKDGVHKGKNGSYDANTNTIEIDVYAGRVDAKILNDTIIPTLSHEVTHWMKAKSPSLYNNIREEIITTLAKQKNVTSTELVAQELKNNRRAKTEEQAIDELVARGCEDMLSNSNKARKLIAKMSASEQQDFISKVKGTFDTLMQWVNDLLSHYKSNSEEAKLLREYKKDLKKISKMWDEMLVSAVEANKALQKEGITGEKLARSVSKSENKTDDVQLSVREIIGVSGTNYGMGVYLDSNLLTGLTEDERKQMVREYVVTELAGQHFIAYDNNSNAVDIRLATKGERFKTENGKRRKVLKELYNKYNGQIVKQEAVVLIDELVATARYDGTSPANHKHDWLDNDGKNDWDDWKVFIQEKNKSVWEATLNIANTANGEKILYDISPIKMVEQARKSATSTTDDIISQDDTESQVQNSDRDNGYSKLLDMQTEIHQLTERIRGLESSEEFGVVMDTLSEAVANGDTEKGIAAYNKWLNESGYNKAKERRDSLQKDLDKLKGDLHSAYVQEELDKEQKAIAKSGLSEADYFRKQAVKEFGYTPYFYDAGYITPNGKMLNFSGEKGMHYGTRGQDHRAIGAVYANVEGSQAMIKFMGDGNIRIMAESPGIDISSSVEPTKEQYATIRKFVREYAKKEYFNVDLTDADGHTVGNYEYEGKVSAERVVNDIKYFFENGTTREQSSISQFLYSDRDTAYLDAVNKGDTETASRMVEEAAEKAFANSKVRGSDGKLRLVYHGTVNEFTVFNRQFANIEGDFGKGYYFTSNEYDVDANYANEEGPDLKNKIARLAERLEWEDEYSDLSYEEREEIARQRFVTSEPNTITAYLNMENPVYINPDEKGTFLDYNEEYDEETDEYGEPEGLLIDFVEALEDNVSNFESYGDVDFSFLYEAAYAGGVYAADAVQKIKNRILDEVTDENGDLAINEIIRLAFEQIGFDGIIDTSVYYKFRNMDGMDSGTTHYIVFDSNQIKSADIATYDDNGNVIPLSERFNESNEDIRYSDRDKVYMQAVKSGDMETAQRLVYEAAKEAGYTDDVSWRMEHSAPNSKTDVSLDKLKESGLIPDDFWEHPEWYTYSSEERESYYKVKKAIEQQEKIAEKGLLNREAGMWIYRAVDKTKNKREEKVRNGDWVTPSKDYAINEGKMNPNGYRIIGHYAKLKDLYWDGNSIAELGYDDGNNYAYADTANNRKLLDPVTYDYDGSIIPLSKRFKKRNYDVRFSDRETETIYDKMGEADRLQKENEKLKADIDRLNERLKIEKQVTHGNYFNENQLNTVAGHLRKIANSTYSKESLVNQLKDVYSYIVQSENLVWDNLFAKCYEVAQNILTETKPITQSDDYAKSILKDIRSKRISLSETQKQEARYIFGKNYRNSFMGKVMITNDGISLDTQWQEWSQLYPEYFDDSISEADQINALYDIYDDLKDVSEMVVEYDTEEQTRWLATEIYNQYWNVSPIRTTADKYDKKIKLLNFEHRRTMSELRTAYNERLDEKLKAQKAADRQRTKELVDKLRERKDREIAEVKQHSKERMDKYKENAERKTVIQSITQKALTLNKWLVKNSKDEHIHEALKEPVINLLQAIDFSSKRLLNKGEPTQQDISLSKALRKVKDMMVDASNGNNDLVELYGHKWDEALTDLVDSVDDAMRKVGDNEFVLNQMTLEELKTLNGVVGTIKSAVSKMNKFHTVNHAKGIANLSQETMVYLDSLGKAKVYDGLRGGAKKLLNWGNALPYYVFKRYGDGGKKVFEAFQDGWDKFAFHIKDIIDYANDTYSSKEVNAWENDIRTFKIVEPATEYEMLDPNYKEKHQEVQMSIPQIMSLYCLQKREQAVSHILGGGIRVADIKVKKGEVISQTDGVVLSVKDIATIIDSLTDRQKLVADKLQRFMNTTCTDWGNEVSMLRFGYKAFGEENYFPIQSDKNNLAVNDETEQINSLFKLLNMSFTKSTIEKANNRIVISNIFDVFAQHTSDMAKYNALALPVLDAFKWYNYTEKVYKSDTSFKTMGVKQSMESAFGKDAQGYFTTFLKDINGQQEVSRDTLGKHFFTNAKIASVGMNIRVALLQPTSYLRASAVINNRYLTMALAHKPKIKMAEKYCGMALWKSMGYYDTNIQKGVEEQIKHDTGWKDKAVDISMIGAEWGDKLTWGYLWNACELEIRKTRKDLKVGSQEFYETIGKRLREIIYATQVVDSTMTRSQMMRSGQMYDKMLTAFASEPTLAYNMLQDAYMEYKLDSKRMGKKEAVKKNGKKIVRVLSAYTATNAIAALVESAFDVFRDDEDEEMDVAEFMKLYLGNFAADMSITAKIPYIKELVSIAQGFTTSRTDTQWMQSFGYALQGIMKIAQGKGNAHTTGKHLLRTVSYLSGLPFYNFYRDTMATLNKLDIFTAEELEELLEDFFG